MEYLILIFGGLIILKILLNRWVFNKQREQRRNYYRNEYLKSDEWRRKRYVVLKRDNWRCVYCGAHATQVHHKKYARWNIGREPIDWLVSVCKFCHDARHKSNIYEKDPNHFVNNINKRSPDHNTFRNDIIKPSLREWLRNNPHKSINDYFSKFGN